MCAAKQLKTRHFNSLSVTGRGELSARLLLGERRHLANPPKPPVPLLNPITRRQMFPPGWGTHTNSTETGDALGSEPLYFCF